MTPGALYGVAGAITLLMIAVALPRAAQLPLVGFALLAATAIVNLAPANPYNTAVFSLWQQGHYLNFNGLTRLRLRRLAVRGDALSGPARRRSRPAKA